MICQTVLLIFAIIFILFTTLQYLPQESSLVLLYVVTLMMNPVGHSVSQCVYIKRGYCKGSVFVSLYRAISAVNILMCAVSLHLQRYFVCVLTCMSGPLSDPK